MKQKFAYTTGLQAKYITESYHTYSEETMNVLTAKEKGLYSQ